MTMLYFAYGSNMDRSELMHADRCPSAEFVCIAKLKKHRLAFTRKSINRGCGVADLLSDSGQYVLGVVYEIPDFEVEFLDVAEGYRAGRDKNENSYNNVPCEVFKENGQKILDPVFTYIANKQENPPLPNEKYKKHLIKGAIEWGLPKEYIKTLEQIKTKD